MSSTVHDLKTLIQSHHSVIAIESVEEQRIRHFLTEAALNLGMSLFEWPAAKGLSRSKDHVVYGNTTDPRRALLHPLLRRCEA